MIKSFLKNFHVLRNAIGNEPIKQIASNAFRKILGFEPVHAGNRELSYEDYCETRLKVLSSRSVNTLNGDKIAVILIAIPNSHDIDSSLDSLKKQSVNPDQIIIVGQNKNSFPKDVLVCPTIDEAIAISSAPYLCLAQSKHFYYPHFIQEALLYLQDHDVDILHTCYDTLLKGKRVNGQMIPQLNVHLLYANNYIGDAIIVKKSFGHQLNWFSREAFRDCYVYDFIFKAIDFNATFYCLPDVLYGIKDPIARNTISERKTILNNHLKRNKWSGEVVEGKVQQTLRIKWKTDRLPLVSIIIPFRDKVDLLKNCVESILSRTDYKNYEIILADNRSQLEKTDKYIKKIVSQHDCIRHIRVDMPFNFSAINNYAVTKSSGERLLFLNNDTVVINSQWLSEMVMEMQRPSVGIVGAKLLYEDDTVQHAGVIYGIGHVAGHAFRYLPDTDHGHMNRASLVQEYKAVTGACLLTKRCLFDKVGGFDHENLAIAYNDVDFCLSANELGYKVIYSPNAKLYHLESKSRANDLSEKEVQRYEKECIFMTEKWHLLYEVDPFFHVHLDNRFENFEIKNKNA